MAEAAWAGEILDRFVVLEGLDGAGTTTQVRLLQAALERRGERCRATAEPTAGPIGTLIRSVLAGQEAMTPCSLALLFAADRSEHLYAPGGIVAALQGGSYVASDRYLFSSLVYQSLGCPEDYIAALNARFPLPRRLIFIDTPPQQCQQRIAGRRRRELFDHLPLQQRLRRRYFAVLRQFAGYGVTVRRVDGNGSREAVFARIWQHFQD